MIRDFVLAPASVNDVAVAPELLGEHQGLTIFGDNGYLSASLAAALQEERRITLATPLRRNRQPARDPAFVRLLSGVRQIIEAVNAPVDGSVQDRAGTMPTPSPGYERGWHAS